jgi:hypothetical protein
VRSRGARDRLAQESRSVVIAFAVAELMQRRRATGRHRVGRGLCRVLDGQSMQDVLVGDEGWYT